MKIFLSGTDREYDLQCLSLLFFPGSDFSTADGKELFVKIEGKTAEAVFKDGENDLLSGNTEPEGARHLRSRQIV